MPARSRARGHRAGRHPRARVGAAGADAGVVELTSVAALVSRIAHPFLVPIPTLVAALRLDGVGWGTALGWCAVCIVVGIVPPTLLLVVQRRRHGDRDWYVTVREQRFGLYALGLVCLAALIAVAQFGGAPRLLLPCLVAALAATVVGAVLNRATKVSVHVGAATGCALLLAFLAPRAAPAFGAVVALVAWSRLRLSHHTPLQVVLGAGVAASCMSASLLAFGLVSAPF